MKVNMKFNKKEIELIVKLFEEAHPQLEIDYFPLFKKLKKRFRSVLSWVI